MTTVPTQENPATPPTQQKPVTRRWVRFWARMFDMYLFYLAAGILLAMIAPQALMMNDLALGLVLLCAWVFVESWLLSTFQTTLGKWLLKTRIALASGEPITYSKAQARSLKVWIRGLAIGVPLLSLVTLIMSSISIERDGITSWDKEEGFIVTHEKIGAVRVLAAMLFFGFCLLLMYLSERAPH
jgi:uncharacterized RDD family membrane protein YckC